MVIFSIKMTAIKFPIKCWNLISIMSIFDFLAIFFIIFAYIFGPYDLDLWPKVINFHRVWASAISNYLAKTASKLVHSFGWKFVHKKRAGHTHTNTHRQTDTQTNWSENITPPRFRGGVTTKSIKRKQTTLRPWLWHLCVITHVDDFQFEH